MLSGRHGAKNLTPWGEGVWGSTPTAKREEENRRMGERIFSVRGDVKKLLGGHLWKIGGVIGSLLENGVDRQKGEVDNEL